MGTFSDYWENKVLDHLFSKGAYPPPAIFLGLSTANPGEDGSGLSEPVGNGYARVQTVATDWNEADGGLLNNAAPIAFNAATGDWPTVTHFALFDAASGGNMLAYGVLNQAKTVNSADRAEFPAGDLNVTLD